MRRLKMRHSRYFLSTIYVCLHNGWLASSFLTRPFSALTFHSHSTPAVNSASSWRSIAPGTLLSAFTQPSSIHNSIEPRHPSKSRLYEQSPQTQLSPSDQEVTSSSSSPSSFAKHALLFSSLTDGIVPNPSARSFLRHSLLTLLLQERVAEREVGLKTSVEFSPCNGPDIDALTNLETVDDLLARGRDMAESVDFCDNLKETSNSSEMEHWSRETINHLLSNSQSIDVRILYIPTAMYALNPQSGNTPGKQRQRARADGKKRRAQLLQLVEELMFPTDGTEDDDFYGSDGSRKWNLLAVTLDLDDGSLKQPVGGYGDESLLFPEDDKAALTTWKPHIIYVEGGNTFWLQHCIEKGNYEPFIKNACTVKNVNDDDFASIYMGKSAGAIVAGKTVATATWKGWDDPSIVPGKETYEDWMNSKGLEMVGDCSFFPHMSEDWVGLVEEKKKDILNIDGDDDDKEDRVICLREEDVCCVGGARKSYFSIRSGPNPSPQ